MADTVDTTETFEGVISDSENAESLESWWFSEAERTNRIAELARENGKIIDVMDEKDPTLNIFCATGPGGGVDPSCTADSVGGGAGKGGDGASSKSDASSPTGKSREYSAADRAKYGELKRNWAKVNNDLLYEMDRPDSPQAQTKLNELKNIVKEMHTLNADPGGWEGIGLPGGPRDVVVVGGGPGGLSASIMGGTDGLDTLLIEATDRVGGQAKYSSRIENYPGFPMGISGKQLAENMHEQAQRVGAQVQLNTRVTGMTHDESTGIKTLTLSNGEKIESRAVVIAGGLEFRKMNFPGSDSSKVIYGDSEKIMNEGAGKPVVMVGGSNGAAQAALGAARKAEHVYLMSRSEITKGMSDYQVSAVRNHPKITVVEGDTVDHFNEKENKLYTKEGRELPCTRLGVFVGSAPKLDWMPKELKLKDGKVDVNNDLETSIPGVFAIGDIRSGTITRVGAAVGDGQLAQRNVHQYFERAKKKATANVNVNSTTRERANKIMADALRKAAQERHDAFRDEWMQTIDEAFALDKEHPFFGMTEDQDNAPDEMETADA